MKKILLSCLLAMGLVGTVSAQSIKVDGSVGLGSNSIYRGVSLTDKDPALTASVRASAKIGQVTAYVSETGTNVTDGSKFVMEVGAKSAVGPVGVQGGYRYKSLMNKSFKNTFNSDEVFVGANTNLLGGTASAEYVKGIRLDGFKDDFVKVGFERQVLVPQLKAGVAVSATKFDGSDKFTLTAYEVSSTYALTKSLDAKALVSFGGKDKAGSKLDTQTFVGLSYKF